MLLDIGPSGSLGSPVGLSPFAAARSEAPRPLDMTDPHQAYPSLVIGGMRVAALSMQGTVDLMLEAVRRHPRGTRPLIMTSTNGEVIARYHANPVLARLLDAADLVSVDGQPLVLASRVFCATPLPERVATTDLFHAVAAEAPRRGVSFYMLGASEAENMRAAAAVRRRYPDLALLGATHGYLSGEALEAKLAEIDALAPDILWLAMGVPREQVFAAQWAARLPNVGIIKTSGGLFNFLSGTNPRAPDWMQRNGLEWAYRVWREPRRLFWRYLVTNPAALVHMARLSQ